MEIIALSFHRTYTSFTAISRNIFLLQMKVKLCSKSIFNKNLSNGFTNVGINSEAQVKSSFNELSLVYILEKIIQGYRYVNVAQYADCELIPFSRLCMRETRFLRYGLKSRNSFVSAFSVKFHHSNFTPNIKHVSKEMMQNQSSVTKVKKGFN
jgi:hypothetical protein